MQSIDETQREVHDYVNGSRGHARLGAVATITEFLMPEILRDLTKESPNVTLKLTIGMTDFLLDNLRRDELDVVISPIYETGEFDCEPIRSSSSRAATIHLPPGSRRFVTRPPTNGFCLNRALVFASGSKEPSSGFLRLLHKFRWRQILSRLCQSSLPKLNCSPSRPAKTLREQSAETTLLNSRFQKLPGSEISAYSQERVDISRQRVRFSLIALPRPLVALRCCVKP